MGMRFWLAALCLLLSLSACGADGAQRAADFDRAALEREVYEFVVVAPEGRSIVVRTPRISVLTPMIADDDPDGYFDFLHESMPTLERETWNDLVARGAEEAPFPEDVAVDGTLHLLTVDEFDDYFGRIDGTAWERFEAEYGARAVHTYSSVGFNADGSQALLYHAVVCGPLCGNGEFVLLEREGDMWRVTGNAGVWIS